MKLKIFNPLILLGAMVTSALIGGQVHAANTDWDHTGIAYGTDDPSKQYLNIDLADTAEPAPVYFWAHYAGGTAYTFSQENADLVKAAGYTVVSWNSLEARLLDVEGALITWSDAELAFNWIRANAATYNIDPDRIIIGGASRGSAANWPLAHSGHPAIEGIYTTNGLPDPTLVFKEMWDPVDDVNAASPPIFMVYKTTPGDGDIHRPENAYPIRDRYTELGLGDTFTTYDGMRSEGKNSYYYFADLVATIESGGPRLADLVDNFDGGNTDYSWSGGERWYLGAGTYNQDGITGSPFTYAGNSAWTDYTFAADMITVDNVNRDWRLMSSSLIFRISNIQNFYHAQLNTDGELQLHSKVNGTNTLIASAQTGYSPFSWLRYKIVVAGESIQISINNELLIDTSNSDHGSGFIALRTNKSSASIDNLSVIQP